jgi:isochorismate hydrolase
MPTYQEFAKKAKERFALAQKEGEKKKSTGAYQITRHAEYKMKQYGLSLQKVKGVIRSPRRIEKGVATNTIAVMQPVNPKSTSDVVHKSLAHNLAGNEAGKFPSSKEIWKQEIWVMYQTNSQPTTHNLQQRQTKKDLARSYQLKAQSYKIISAWRYPGISPTHNPIPSEILLELEDELT